MSELNALLSSVRDAPDQIEFADIIAFIDEHYIYVPSTFSNGDVVNQAGTNEGSCKIFAFALLNKLAQAQTLALFGRYYREDVLKAPNGNDHANIRNFMRCSWAGVEFGSAALSVKVVERT